MASSYYWALTVDQKTTMYKLFIAEVNSFFNPKGVRYELTKEKRKRLDYVVEFINEYEQEFNIIAK